MKWLIPGPRVRKDPNKPGAAGCVLTAHSLVDGAGGHRGSHWPERRTLERQKK